MIKEDIAQKIDDAKNRIATDKFEQQFRKFLDESDLADVTKDSYLSDYASNIHIHEIAKNKPLCDFNEEDVIEVINSVPTSSRGVKYKLFKVINSFEYWAFNIDKSNHAGNPCDNINFEDIVKVNKSLLEYKYIELEKAYEICYKALDNGSEYQDVIPFMLCRYGLRGLEWSEIRYLKNEDVDLENGFINVTNRDSDEFGDISLRIIKRVKIDKRMVNLLKNAMEEDMSDLEDINDKRKVKNVFLDHGYVCKASLNAEEVVLDKQTLRWRFVSVFDANDMPRLSMKDVYKSAKFEALNNILEAKKEEYNILEDKKRKDLLQLTNYDFISIQKYFEPYNSSPSYVPLKKEYGILFGEDKVMQGRRLKVYATLEETEKFNMRVLQG